MANDGTPCNFISAYKPLPATGKHDQKYELYSYVVIERLQSDAVIDDNKNNPKWPRLVRPTLVRTRHAICRMCTNKGELNEIIFTQAKHGK